MDTRAYTRLDAVNHCPLLMRKPIIAANWKMHKTPSETEDFLKDFLVLAQSGDSVDIVIAPPYISLAAALAMLTNRDHVRIAAQNMHD